MMDNMFEINLGLDWVKCQLIDLGKGKNAIVDGPFGSNLKTSDYIIDKVNGVPVLTTKNLKGDYSEDSVRYISKEKYEELKRSEVKTGDIIVAKIGSIGKTGIYPANRPTAIIPANLLKFSVTKKVIFNYVYYYLNYEGFQKFIRLIATATAQPAFNVTKFRNLPIPLAPLPEQRAIVAKIEQLFSELDHGIANLRAAKAKLDIYRQAVLKKAFEGGLTRAWREKNGINGDFKVVKIEELVADLTQGWSPKCMNEPSMDITEWAVIKTSAIQHGQFIENENKILPGNLEPRSQHEIQKGDILITRAGPRVRVGVCCLVKSVRPKLINCDKVYRLRLKENVNNEFFEYKMTSLEFIHKIEEIKTGGNDSGVNLTQNRFLNLELSLPQIEEQHQIVQEIESRLSVCDNILANIDEGLEKAEALRQSILKKAFEGRLLSAAELAACRAEPDWAPAGELLARIRKEK